MNSDDHIDHSSSAHEVEEVLRTLQPRAPRFDVESICEASASRASSAVPRPASSRLSWLAVGGSCAASALVGAAMVFLVLRGQISDLQKEIAHLSQTRVEISTSGQVKDIVSPTDTVNVEPTETIVAAASKPYVSPLPQLLRNESNNGNKLSVGSHLKHVAYRQSKDVSWPDTVVSFDRALDASGATSDRSRPATRATLLEDLLDT